MSRIVLIGVVGIALLATCLLDEDAHRGAHDSGSEESGSGSGRGAVAAASASNLRPRAWADGWDTWHAEVGDRFDFSLAADSRLDLQSADFGMTTEDSSQMPRSTHLQIHGAATATVLAVLEDRWRVGFALRGTMSVEGAAAARLICANAIVEMDLGRVLRFGFGRAAGPEERRLCRWLFCATHQFVSPGDPGRVVDLSGLGDEIGVHSASFSWAADPNGAEPEVIRRKSSYALRSEGGEKLDIARAIGRARFARGWIADVVDESEYSLESDAAIARMNLTVSLTRTGCCRVEVASVGAPDEWEDAFVPSRPADDCAAANLSLEDARRRTDEIIARLGALGAASDLSSDEALKLSGELSSILGAHPEVVAEVVAGLRARTDVPAASLLASCVAVAAAKGSTAALEAVAGLLADLPALRGSMLMALHEATGAAAARLTRVVTELARSADDTDTGNAAFLLAGKLHSQLQDPAAKEAVGKLLSEGLRDSDDARRAAGIYAISNSQDPDLAARALALSADPAAGVRLAVVELASSIAAGRETLRSLIDDPDTMVAARALRGLGSEAATGEDVRLLVAALEPAGHAPELRLTALQALVPLRARPEVAAALSEAARTDPDPNLRAFASSLR